MKRHLHWGVVPLLLLCHLSSTLVAHAQETTSPFLDPAKAITEYVHTAWGEEDGLPQGSINAIEQTDDGYVWLGTQEGLVRFDGIRFKVFNTRTVDVFRGHDIRVLKRDQQGALWIGTLNAGIYRYANGDFTRATTEESLNDAGITDIIESQQGEIWIGTANSGLKQLRDDMLISVPLPTQSVSALLETEAGTLWIGSRDAGLFRYQNGKMTTFTQSHGLPDADITSLAASKNGGIWIGTRSGGLAHFHSDTFYVATTEHGLPTNRIFTLFEDAAGSLWIGTDQAGLTRLRLEIPDLQSMEADIGIQTAGSTYNPTQSAWEDALRLTSFSSANGLTYDVVKTLFLDREGNLLIGTDGGGLNLLREGIFTMYTENAGLPDDFVYAVHEDLFGTMWFSTEKGVGRLAKGNISSYNTADGLPDDFIVSLASMPDSSVWMGSYGNGLSRFYKGNFTTYTQEHGLPENRIYGLFSDSKGDLWIGTGGGAAKMHEDGFTPFTANEGLSSDLVTVMLESRDGSVWIGTYNAGLNKVHEDKLVSFAASQRLEKTGILALHEDDAGTLWIGTYGDGLIRLKNDDVTFFTTEDGLYNDTILQILEDDMGFLWMSSNQGLFRVDKHQLNSFASQKTDAISSIVYGKGDGIKSSEFNGGVQPAGWKSQDGRLWFPSKHGVAMLDPKKIRKNETPPMVKVESIEADGESIPLEGQVRLAAGTYRTEIHYAGLSLVSPKKMRYQYQLIGTDRDWVEAGNRRFAYYSNLKPGKHAFRVRAQNSDGVWSQRAATFSFYHKPFFHQTFWFYLILAGLVAVGIVGTIRWRTAQLRAQKQFLEHEVNERTQILEERTADLMTALEQNKEILSITSHDLKNPLSGFIGLSEVVLEDLAEVQTNTSIKDGLESIQLMKNEAERMLRIVQALLDKHRSQDKSQLPNIFNLVQLVKDVIHRHQRHAEAKNIWLIFDHKDALHVQFYEDAMLRIADNLISNAIKFSPPGNNVWITLSPQHDQVTFMVRDEGPGLTEDDFGKVFGKMQRLSAQPTAGEESTGWGLFIVKQLAEEYGASVGVNSTHGEGATFWVKVPRHSKHFKASVVES